MKRDLYYPGLRRALPRVKPRDLYVDREKGILNCVFSFAVIVEGTIRNSENEPRVSLKENIESLGPAGLKPCHQLFVT
jgi:hypothetical protein